MKKKILLATSILALSGASTMALAEDNNQLQSLKDKIELTNMRGLVARLEAKKASLLNEIELKMQVVENQKKEIESLREEKAKKEEAKRQEEEKKREEERKREEEKKRQEEARKAEEEKKNQEAEKAKTSDQTSNSSSNQATSSPVSYGTGEAREAFEKITSELKLTQSQKDGWADIINRESGWNVTISNPSSGAYGLPQALPGSKMASHGSDWTTNPYTQLRWMHDYMVERYGGIEGALAFWYANSWY